MSADVIVWDLETVPSGLQRLGVAPHNVELALNHRSGTFSGVAGIYQRHRYAR
jgi:hypothetical protein